MMNRLLIGVDRPTDSKGTQREATFLRCARSRNGVASFLIGDEVISRGYAAGSRSSILRGRRRGSKLASWE